MSGSDIHRRLDLHLLETICWHDERRVNDGVARVNSTFVVVVRLGAHQRTEDLVCYCLPRLATSIGTCRSVPSEQA